MEQYPCCVPCLTHTHTHIKVALSTTGQTSQDSGLLVRKHCTCRWERRVAVCAKTRPAIREGDIPRKKGRPSVGRNMTSRKDDSNATDTAEIPPESGLLQGKESRKRTRRAWKSEGNIPRKKGRPSVNVNVGGT